MEAPTRRRSGTPISGLKNSQAIAIVRMERVSPTTIAKMTAATATSPERSHPTSGIMSRSLMIGEKSK